MSEKDVEQKTLELVRESGAFLEGHFLFTSGLHSPFYFQCALLLRYPRNAAYTGEQIARRLEAFKPDIVVSPAMGGVIIGHEVARYLDVPFLFCEREDNHMKLRRFPFFEGKRAVVVEDVITTGGSVLEVGTLLQEKGAEWLATACIVDRSAGKRLVLKEPPISLCKVSFPVFDPADCPLCRQGLALVKPGSRQLKY